MQKLLGVGFSFIDFWIILIELKKKLLDNLNTSYFSAWLQY